VTDAFMLDLKEVGYGRMRVSNYKKDGTVFEVTISVFPVFDSTAPNNNTNNGNKGMMMKDGGDSAVLTHLASILTDVKVYPPGYGRGGSSSDETSSFDGTSTNASNYYPSHSIGQNDTNIGSTNSGVKEGEEELMMNTTSEEANQTSSGSNQQFSGFRPSLSLYESRSEQQHSSQTGSNQGTTSSSLTSDKNHLNSAEVTNNNNNHQQQQQQQQGAPHEAQQHQQFMQHHHNLQQQQQPHHNYYHQQSQFMNNYYQRPDNNINNHCHDRNNNTEVPREEEGEEEDGQEDSYEETNSSRESDSPNYDRREKAKKFDAKCVISEEVNPCFFFFSEVFI
jgi:hypothetical protein